jgi:hypothetical protein
MTEGEADTVAQFHIDQIDEILIRSTRDQNIAWTASIQSAINAMERGVFAKIFAKRVAANVLANATAARQREGSPNNRWHIASLVESLATLRLVSLSAEKHRSTYAEAKRGLLHELPPLN